MGELTPQEFAILDFEATGWGSAGRKEWAIAQMLGMTPITYYQRLNALLDDERALRQYPVMVNRLRRAREPRSAERRR